MIVRKTRLLPIPGDVLVKLGDDVESDTIVARTEAPGEPHIIEATNIMGLDSEGLPRYMVKKVGDRVNKNEVVAQWIAFFGLIKRIASSPIDGTVESFSDSTGRVIVREDPIPIEVAAYIPGKIVEIIPNMGVSLETNAAFIQGIFGIGGGRHGQLTLLVGSPDEILTDDMISSEYEGKIIVGGSFITIEALKKAIEKRVTGIVVGGIDAADLTKFLGYEIGVAITGEEEIGITLIITEGFGEMSMSQRTFDLLKRFEGYMASMNGATQIRAGVIRPEIIIPHEESFEQASGDELAAGMVPGTPVRIIRMPHFGAIGKVVSLPVELQQVGSESYMRVLEVELDDGKVVTVPRANVEIIEE
ncbi:MAG: hypothetical protein HWN68_12530 [Desulfobacterales bacterium]|nr:hypothetical protein [Desulfobacterales bacterium]